MGSMSFLTPFLVKQGESGMVFLKMKGLFSFSLISKITKSYMHFIDKFHVSRVGHDVHIGPLIDEGVHVLKAPYATRGSVSREFFKKSEHFGHSVVDLLALLENGVLKSFHSFALTIVESQVLNDFSRFVGILIAEFTAGGAVNLALKMKGDMIIKDLDLKPTINAMMRDFLTQNPNPNVSLVNCEESEEEEEGENNIGFDSREQRSTRESTPCNSIKDMNVICTPGSSTRPRNLEASNQINQNSVTRIMPLAHEIEEFFARHEQEQQRRFADKYNFDIVNENPLEGRYEWPYSLVVIIWDSRVETQVQNFISIGFGNNLHVYSLVDSRGNLTVVLSNMGDRRFWDLNGDGCFRVKDVRRMLDDMLLPKSDVPSRWVKQIPIKVNVLAWKISIDRLLTRVNLHRRGVQVSPISCPICCEALENLDHLLFCCNLAKDIARFNQVRNRCWKECFTLSGEVSGHIETISSSLIQILEMMLENAVSTIFHEYLLEFTSEYCIPESLHPEFHGPEDPIVEFPGGKVGVYTKFFEFANF
nr:cyclin-dependent kinase inhibitor [Tanacetum cinerariifolium]